VVLLQKGALVGVNRLRVVLLIGTVHIVGASNGGQGTKCDGKKNASEGMHENLLADGRKLVRVK
jgi:hypothetical protein